MKKRILPNTSYDFFRNCSKIIDDK